MAYTTGILLGSVTKVSGFGGTVSVRLERTLTENIPLTESVFLEIEGRPVPFFISYSEYSGAAILKLKFEGYDSVEKISEFTGCRVFLTTVFSGDKHTEDAESLVGFRVLIRGSELLGLVSEVIPNPGQWLLNIVSEKDKDILIPFHEHFILSIDKKKKIIVMDIPEGLTEIN